MATLVASLSACVPTVAGAAPPPSPTPAPTSAAPATPSGSAERASTAAPTSGPTGAPTTPTTPTAPATSPASLAPPAPTARAPSVPAPAQTAAGAGGAPTPDTAQAVGGAGYAALAPAAVVPGSLVDVTVNVAGPSSGAAGVAYTYSVTIGNNSLPDADGAAWTVVAPSGSTSVAASCTASGGAACPAALTTTNTQVKGTAPLLPHNGQVTVTITGRFGAPSASSVTCQGTVTAPAGTADFDTTSNTSTVATTVSNATGVMVTQTQTSTSMAAGVPNTYTLTWVNNGPAAADGTTTLAMMYFRTDVYDHADISGFSCTATGGLTCPTTTATTASGAYGAVFSQAQPAFPPGASMTVTYTATLVAATAQKCGYPTISVGADVRATLPTGFANVGTTDLFIYATAPGTPTCPTTDLAVTKTQSSASIGPDAPVTYTVTYRNLGPSDADGASLSDAMYFATPVQSLSIRIMSCTPTGAAQCPTLSDKTLTGTGQYVLQSNAPRFPAGSSIQLVYTATPVLAATPACSLTGSSSVENRALIAPPAGVSEVGNAPNQGSVFATAPSAPACPRAALTVTQTVDKPTLFPADPTTYTVTYTNLGPDSADGAWITEYLELLSARFINNAAVTIQSCVGRGGASCPSFVTSKTVSASSYLWSGSIGSFPAGATLTIVASVDPTAGGSTCPTASATIPNTATISLPSGMSGSGGTSGAVNVTAACADIAVNKSLDRSSVQPGDPVTYSVRVSNASVGAARSVQVTDSLPRGFVFNSATCTPSSATSTCGQPTYDPASRTVSALIPVVGPNQGYVTLAIKGNAGPVGGTYSNTATAGSLTTGADRFIDPVTASNSSTAVLTIYGTASRVTVTKRLSGLPAGGVPASLTFTGTITCNFEGTKPWSVTVPAGASSAAAAPVLFFDGQQCTVAQNPAPALPAGFTWLGEPTYDPVSLSVTGPSAQYDVSVTNRLTPNAALQLAKTASRTQATVGQQVTFTYQVTNGGDIPVANPVIHEMSFSGGGSLPAANCPTGEIAPQDSVECAATYTITPADVESGLLTNVAYATATPAAGPPPRTAPASASVRVVAPPALSLSKIATPDAVTAVGDEVVYTYVVTNTGGVALTAPGITESAFSGAGEAPLPQCLGATSLLDVGQELTCTATYTVTQADLDAGGISNTAVASASAPDGFDDPHSAPATASVSATQQPSLSLTKSVFPVAPLAYVPGTQLTYTFVATNTGNVTLTGVRVDDVDFTGTGDTTQITCDTTTLAPGHQATCTLPYLITASDAAAGKLVNTAAATGSPPVGPPVTSEADTAIVPDAAAPALVLVKSATPTVVHTAGEVVHFTYTMTNTGNVPLTDPGVGETDFTGVGDAPEPSCPGDTVLPGESLTCSAQYTVTPGDLQATSLTNTAVGAGTAPSGSRGSSAPASFTIDVVRGMPGITLDKSASRPVLSAAGQEITYSLTVVNSGQTPLQDVRLAEAAFTGTGTPPALECPDTQELEAGARLTCMATYTVTQADIDAGRVVNTATVLARPVPDFPGEGEVTASDTAMVPVDTRPALALVKTATPAGPLPVAAGERITYGFEITNTGNATLTDATLVEGQFSGTGALGTITCAQAGPLAPGDSAQCSASYQVTSPDIEEGNLTNTAQAVAVPPAGAPVYSADASAVLTLTPQPALALSQSATPTVVHQAGQSVTYTFEITNTGNVAVRTPTVEEVTFTGSAPPPSAPCPAGSLAPGDFVTCTATYVVTQEDVLHGAIDNTAIATAIYGTATNSPPSGTAQVVAELLAPATVTSRESSAHVEIDPPVTPTDTSVLPPVSIPSSPQAEAGTGGTDHRGAGLAWTGTAVTQLAVFTGALLLLGLALVRSRHRRHKP